MQLLSIGVEQGISQIHNILGWLSLVESYHEAYQTSPPKKE